MSMVPGDMSSRIRAYESGLGPNPFQRMMPDVMPMQPREGIAGLFEGFRRPMFPPMGGFGGFGGGRFGPPPFNPFVMRGGFPGMGGGFFGGFRPRLRRRRRPRPEMPDYSKQFSALEAKIAELQKQLADSQAARQTATPMPDSVMDMPIPKSIPAGIGTTGPGGAGAGSIQIPNIDVEAIKQRIADLNLDMGRPVKTLPSEDVGGRKNLTKGPGASVRIPVKPPSIERLPFDPLNAVDSMGVPIFGGRSDLIKPPTKPPSIEKITPPEPMPAPVMPAPTPMPSLPKFPMPQIDPIGRVAAPLTRGPVNTAINMPAVGMRGPGIRMR